MMSDQPRPEEMRTDASAGSAGEDKRPIAEIKQPRVVDATAIVAADTSAAKPGEPVSANQLTPEEQMARFAKELKENDWGHQPC